MLSISYRSDLGRNLSAAEVDGNFYTIASAIVELQTTRPQPNNIASITVAQTTMTIILDDGTEIGPLPLPVLAFSWRGEWAVSTVYDVLDVFTVQGQGLYVTRILHTSDPTAFDEALTIDGDAVYQKIMGALPAPTTIAFLDPSGGPISYDLPTGAALYDTVTVKDLNGGATLTNTITVTTTDGSLIDGAASFVINIGFASFTFMWNGTGWSVT